MFFALFTLYQITLVFQIADNRFGRLIGIGFFAVITVASFLNLSDSNGMWNGHFFLLVTTLILLFAYKIVNLADYLNHLKLYDIIFVLKFSTYILSQLGVLVLVAGYMLIRTKMEQWQVQKIENILMSIVILLFVANFVIECVLLIQYHINIDIRTRYTLMSRVFYCLGFVGTAFGFLLPIPKERRHGRSHHSYSENDDGEVDFLV